MRLSEIYTSIQGEGPRVGTPTTFIRFAGCNLKCPGWPCDTPHAIDPTKYRKEWTTIEPWDLEQVLAKRDDFDYVTNFCLTGGEPFLQPASELQSLVQFLNDNGKHVEVFTNGTLVFPDWCEYQNMHFVMDWKLPGSGEIGSISSNAPQPEKGKYTRWIGRYLEQYGKLDEWGGRTNAVKFTVASQEDMDEARRIWGTWFMRVEGCPQVFCGAVWGKVTEAWVAEQILEHKLPWKLNVQIHNHIWDRTKRGI